MLDSWDNISGITERQEFALSLLRELPSPAEIKPIDYKALRSEASQLILTQPLTQQLTDAPKRITVLTPEQLVKPYQNIDLVENFCKALRNRVAEELHAGHHVPGFKLVTGK